jgi:hypothetical protein
MTKPLTDEERRDLITELYDDALESSFSEGCEARILEGLQSMTNEQLVARATKKGIK